jgi:hypothetical protein
MENTIEGVAERADFGPAYKGEEYVTMTFRVPKNTVATPGVWELRPVKPGWPEWANEKFPSADDHDA